MSDFKSLEVWQLAHQLTLGTFRVTRSLRDADGILVRNQLLRSVMSIPANIAEGSGKQSDAEFARYLRISMGSSSEAEYHVILAADLELITREQERALTTQIIRVRKMLSGLVKFLRTRQKPAKQRRSSNTGANSYR